MFATWAMVGLGNRTGQQDIGAVEVQNSSGWEDVESSVAASRDACRCIGCSIERNLDHTLGACCSNPGFSMSEIDQNCHLPERDQRPAGCSVRPQTQGIDL